MRLRSHVPPVLRRLAVAVASVCGLATPCASAQAAEPAATTAATPHEIKDPHYGDTLFQFFQSHYFASVTGLMVSQYFDRVGHHGDEAEVLRGGMLLSYGMHREAGEIFAQLIEKGAEPKVRDRAWFYLAKIRYQRGTLVEAQAAIANVGQLLPVDLQEERGLLQANLLMARADYSGAANLLDTMNTAKAKAPGARYVRYNLGVALIQAGDPARGSALLDELGRAPAEDEEYRSLRDRANVALGFVALGCNEPKAARGYLERVRLKSLQANKALLGFGWAASAMKEPKLALVPWLELAQRDVNDSAALEARIAVPFAYAELGAFGQSLERYNEAITAFTRENTHLDESITAIRSGTLVNALAERNPGDEMGWFWRLQALPEMPHESHLTPVLAQHEFQEAFKNFRDLRYLGRNLQEWRAKLGVFDDMLAARRKAFAERLPQVRERASGTDLDALRQRGEALAAEVTRGEAAADGAAFANARQVELMKRVEGVQALLNGLNDARESGAKKDAQDGAVIPDLPDLAPARERLRLASGALAWELAQDYSGRVWLAKRELQAITDELAAGQRRDAALAQAQRDEPARFEAFALRIKALAPMLDAAIPRVAALSKEQQGRLQDIAVAELTRQKERLAAYSTQARFAVAQLYDRANDRSSGSAGKGNYRNSDTGTVQKDADHAPKP
ncbi:MAG: tetratricopeptide repeat protein [Bacteriovorax sp.]|nr:tetratricopeptide repeat protein [Rhizobacter sp.]